MKRIVLLLLLGVGGGVVGGCDLLNSQNVENPDLTQEQALNNPDPLQRWVVGLDRQLAVALNRTVPWTAIATDNYKNIETFYNQNVDGLDLNNQQADVERAFFGLHDLRESALFGINTVVPADESPRPEDEAALNFYLSMAHLLLGEVYHSSPLVGEGPPAPSSAHFRVAIDSLQSVIESGNGDQVAYRLAQARAFYNIGNVDSARIRANEVLSRDPDYVRLQQFAPQNTDPGNETDDNRLEDALYDRQNTNDFQPLPRLDFLDPKVGTPNPQDSPLPLLKAEEAHLILIEADLAQGNIPGAKAQMRALVDLVQTQRDRRTINESTEARPDRPDTSAATVRASPSDSFRTGLVLNRTPGTTVASISNTSVTDAMIGAVSTAQEAWELYYLLRQEIFIGEGRRFVTLGLKAPVPFVEADINPNVVPGSEATRPVVPGYITDALAGDPSSPPTLDSFTYTETDDDETNDGTYRVTIDVNMNRVLADHRAAVSPFLSR